MKFFSLFVGTFRRKKNLFAASMQRNLGIPLYHFNYRDQLSFAAIKNGDIKPIIKMVKATSSRETHAVLNITGWSNSNGCTQDK